ncbi:hypothetical protein AB1Y20_011579 [Prymnesium parvum]|uniref:Uncharacterized protein n=1 Tax=Prymnesium parvum TaxID=97485 RepID=A0AB34IHT9_PRYPA
MASCAMSIRRLRKGLESVLPRSYIALYDVFHKKRMVSSRKTIVKKCQPFSLGKLVGLPTRSQLGFLTCAVPHVCPATSIEPQNCR